MAVAVCLSGTLFGQAAAPPLAFEVASVKRDVSGGNGGGTRLLHGVFTATNSTLQALIRYAYGVKDYQIEGPGWMANERYDIEAKANGEPRKQNMLAMLQKLLAERFDMRIRREVRLKPVYVLVGRKKGPKLLESKPTESSSIGSTNHSIAANKITLQVFAGLLSGQIDRPVLDSTGIQGTFDIHLEWTPDGAVADGLPSGPSLFTAIEEQLGLRLESTTGPVEFLLVDHAERVPTEN